METKKKKSIKKRVASHLPKAYGAGEKFLLGVYVNRQTLEEIMKIAKIYNQTKSQVAKTIILDYLYNTNTYEK